MSRIGPDCPVAVFAKAPVPGAVKTRLSPPLHATAAANLHRRLLLHTLATVTACANTVQLHCAPDTAHPVFAAAARRWPLTLHAQQGDDLGERMHAAFREVLAGHRAALLIGTDAPALDAVMLAAASAALSDGCDAVFVPAEDGGYALIGLTRCAARLFAGPSWGTGDVMNETRTALRDLRWRWTELAPVWDVDRPEDYARLAREGWLDALPA
jgi:rSAM/selenodomain-associated transferase 1